MGEDLARVIDEYNFDRFENALRRAQNVTRAPVGESASDEEIVFERFSSDSVSYKF